MTAGTASPVDVGSRKVKQILTGEGHTTAVKPLPATMATYGAATDVTTAYAARICRGSVSKSLAHIADYSNLEAVTHLRFTGS